MNEQVEEISLRRYFLPLTPVKAIYFIILIGVIVYANSLFNGFVWDDYGYIIYNSAAHIFNILYFFSSKSSGNIPGLYFRPLTAAYFTSLYVLFGSDPFMYHFLQILLCITNAILIYFLFRKFFDNQLSFLLSLIFLVHPLNAESVDFISATIGPLSFLFGVIALLLVNKNKSMRHVILINLFLLLSLLVKETGILFLPILLLYSYLFQKKSTMRIFLMESITFFIYMTMRILSIGIYSSAKNSAIPILHANLWEKLIAIPKILSYYILGFVYPNHLSIDQLWVVNQVNIANFYAPLFILVLSIALFVLLGLYIYTNKYRLSDYTFYSVWFILGTILVLPFFPLDLTVADRWAYFPMVGMLGLIGLSLTILFEKVIDSRRITVSFLVIIIVIFAIRTIIRNNDWKSELVLYSHDAKISDNYDLETNLGNAYATQGIWDEAIIHTKNSIYLHPTDAGYYNLGVYYERTNDFKNAQKNYILALTAPVYAINGKHPEIMYIEASWYLISTDPKLSLTYELLGLKTYPMSSMLWLEYAIAEYKLHNQKLAVFAINKARLLSNNPQANMVYHRIMSHKSINLES